MAKLSRVFQKLFGSAAAGGEIAKFGSLAAGTPETTTDVSLIQSYAEYEGGWGAAVIANNSPALQDQNALDVLVAYQLAYLFENGVSEWNSLTTYYIGSLVNSGGVLYRSLTNNNLNNALSSLVNWKELGQGVSLNPQANSTLAARALATWTAQVDGTSRAITAMCWSVELNLYCAISSSGGSGSQVLTSPDGVTWTGQTAAEANDWFAVCWSPEVRLFVAVGSLSGGTHAAMTSPDGATWTARTLPAIGFGSAWRSVCWSPELGLFATVSSDGKVATSPDGVTWTSRTPAATNNWNAICWADSIALFVAVSSDGTNRVMTSPDGTTWTSRSAAAAQTWYAICWSHDLGLLVAVDYNGATGAGMISRDGINWTSVTAAAAGIGLSNVVFAPELGSFIAVGTSSGGTVGNIQTSRDGTTWVARTPAENNSWTCVAWAPQLGMAAAGSIAGTHQFMTSKYVQKFIAA